MAKAKMPIGLEGAINRRMNDIAYDVNLHESWLQLLKDGCVDEAITQIEERLELDRSRIGALNYVLNKE